MGLAERAKNAMPGGVNSPVRAFLAVGGEPVFIKRASGARLVSEDDQAYIDYVMSWGPMILGHSHPYILEAVEKAIKDGLSFGAATKIEVEMAELISEIVPNVGMSRMVSSGTEAVMSAVRLARGFTGRDKVIKFEGCYHGHSDAMLSKGGSGVMTFGQSGSAGVTSGAAKDTLSCPFNSLESVEEAFRGSPGQIAAVIIEPLAANMGVVGPADGFLSGLRDICTREGSLLIFDEVITGFRLALGGAQERFKVDADIVVMGKIIGGGMPVGCYGARREIMGYVSPLGPVYQAGTLSGNPVAMAAGFAQLSWLKSHPEIYIGLEEKGEMLFGGLKAIFGPLNASASFLGSLGTLFFCPNLPFDYDSANKADREAYKKWHSYMLSEGFYLAPSQFEAMFLSDAHTKDDISATLAASKKFADLYIQ